MTTVQRYLTQTAELLAGINENSVEELLTQLRKLRHREGRLFIVGNGGGAAHASHAAADFRKITDLEAYAWGDNTADLTAWANDAGWDLTVVNWLVDSNYTENDGLLIFSVGGTSERVSTNILKAAQYVAPGMILAVTGKPGLLANYIMAQLVFDANTAQTEGLQAVIWHCLVSCM